MTIALAQRASWRYSHSGWTRAMATLVMQHLVSFGLLNPSGHPIYLRSALLLRLLEGFHQGLVLCSVQLLRLLF
jgi:hypothetical protein